LAKVAAAAKLGEKTVVGTKDGMLAVCNGDKVFGLGPAAYNGPVRDLAATPDGKKVYGVAGHDDDLGVVFSYDEEEGLRWLGHVTYAPPCEDGAYNLTTLSACAVSPDGKCLAVANCDRLGQILYYAL
jgi:DNA-binding beta-propeller fold protein YncE